MEAAIDTFYSIKTTIVLSALFVIVQCWCSLARIPVPEVLDTSGLDYQQSSMAGWSKAVAPDGATSPSGGRVTTAEGTAAHLS